MSPRREAFPKEVARYALVMIETLNDMDSDARFDGTGTGPVDLYYRGERFPACIKYSEELGEYCFTAHEE